MSPSELLAANQALATAPLQRPQGHGAATALGPAGQCHVAGWPGSVAVALPQGRGPHLPTCVAGGRGAGGCGSV